MPTASSAGKPRVPAGKRTAGRIYIILGEPQDIERYEGKSSTYDTEVWFYQGKTDLGLPPAFYVAFFKSARIRRVPAL